MIKQLFKIIWKQRRYNSLLIIEIAFSFIALMALSTICIHYWKLYKEPLGMDYKNRWLIYAHQSWDVAPEFRDPDSVKLLKMDQLKKFVQTNYPQVISVCKISGADHLYAHSGHSNCSDYGHSQITYETSVTEPDFAKTFHIKMLEGRWINEFDRLSKIKTVVINNKLKKAFFGTDPVGCKTIHLGKDKAEQIKIVGVFEALKKQGEFDPEPNFMMHAHTEKYNPYSGIAIELKSQVTPDFESRLMHDLNNLDKTYEFSITKMDKDHSYYMIAKLGPLAILAGIVLFLVVNVMLGLFGTLWQNISRRKAEIGLRRAIGATSGGVMWHIMCETYCIALVAIFTGFLFTMQLYIYNLFDTPVSTLTEANLTAFLLIMLMCTLSAFAPGRLAASLQPAEALHEE